MSLNGLVSKLPVPCRSLTRSTTPHGIASLAGTLAAMWRMRRSISSTSTWARWPCCCSSQAEILQLLLMPPYYFCATLYICSHLSADMPTSRFPTCFNLLLFPTYTYYYHRWMVLQSCLDWWCADHKKKKFIVTLLSCHCQSAVARMTFTRNHFLILFLLCVDAQTLYIISWML